MPERKFKVFATDGERVWETLFITQSSQGDFYWGSITPGLVRRWSRHVSGRMHFTVDEVGTRMGSHEREPLGEFSGFEQLPSFGIPKEAFQEGRIGQPYEGERFHASAFIDLRNYRNDINILLFLVQSERVQLVADLARYHFYDAQIIVFTHTSPWIVLVVFEPKPSG